MPYPNYTYARRPLAGILLFLTVLVVSSKTSAQISLVCTNPSTIIYGLTGTGEIREINTANAVTGTIIKNTTYPGIYSPSNSNGIGYNSFNGNFYYFKRNESGTTPQFVSFNPSSNIVTVLASSTLSSDTHTGCVNFNGTGYYTIDINGNLHFYNILTNQWTLITNRIVDQFGADVDAVIRTQNAGDMAIDGWGNIWFVTASSSNYALYMIAAPMPTVPVSTLTVTRVIAPTTPTPTGESFAGIAFNPSGQIFMSTKTGNRLYRMNNDLTLSLIGILSTNDIGNDLTSCNFPSMVLPVTWKSFDVTLQNDNIVKLNWEVGEENNKGFYVQHCLDGTNWQDLSFIASKATADAFIQTYSYTHVNHFSSTQYYRIRQLDNNGKESYSETKTVVIKGNKETITIWPNPATDQIRIVNPNSNHQTVSKAQIFDLSGRPLITKQLQSGVVNTIIISPLPAGIYVVRVENSDGTSFRQKFNKQ
jgi:hypothetical protein